ncbi:MAG: UvrD-helicase domain-containing protein [Planctomycetaceae bacterium]|nr:UvrD-helicase domain-containing protein [Planctomycetaceae bacterium]
MSRTHTGNSVSTQEAGSSELSEGILREDGVQTHSLKTPRQLIRASAGTGKTFQLSSRYISILRTTPVDRILASTFTRKAAGEILERILVRLARAATSQKYLKELADSVDGPPLRKEESLQLLKGLTEQLHRVRISTLDGFFARLATTFSLEIGLPAGWSMLEDLEAELLRDVAIGQMLSEGAARNIRQLMELLDKGKSGRRVHDLISEKVTSFYSLYRRSPRSAWDRFPQVHYLTELEQSHLIDDLAAFPLPDGPLKKARDKDCETMRTSDWACLASAGPMKKVLEGEVVYNRKPIPPEVIAIYQRIHAHVRASIIRPWADQTRATWELLAHFDQLFKDLKRDYRGLQFDDVTHTLATALQEAQADALAFRMDGGIDHLLLDEFQDTSPVQWDVLRPFADLVCQPGRSFFCVGDVKQAIYGWRGGEAAIFDAIEHELPGIESETLARSYRSAPVIMDTVTRVFQEMSRHDNLGDCQDVVTAWAHKFPRHETARTEFSGYACLKVMPLPEASEEESEGDESNDENSAKLSKSDAQSLMYEYVGDYVEQLLQEAPGRSIGVLVRTNASIGQIIYELNRRGIAASEEGGNPLTDSAAVQLILSLLRLADHPGHTIARFHVARSSWGADLGFTDYRDDVQADQLATHVRRCLLQQGYGGCVHRWMKQLAPHCDARELRRLKQLEALADLYEQRLTLRPQDFVRFVETQKVQEPQEALVRVMTIHQSKGLEFDSVVLPELGANLFRPASYYTLSDEPLAPPSFVALQRSQSAFRELPTELQAAYSQTLGRHVEESLCVLYVALTRAVHALHMLIPPSTSAKLPRTGIGLLRAALAYGQPVTPGAVLFEAGDPDWARASELPEPTTIREPAPPLRIQLAAIPEDRKRQLQVVTPSHQEGLRRVRLSQVLPMGNAAALNRGTLFHNWMEQVRWLDEGRPSEARLRQLARGFDSDKLNVEQCLQQFQQMLRQPDIAWCLSRQSYLGGDNLAVSPAVQQQIQSGPVEFKLETERRFTVQVDGDLISGSIDRLVRIYRNSQLIAADILDFKTDSLPDDPQRLQERIEFYRGQMQAYVRAVSRLFGLDPQNISARLVLLSIGRVENVK